MEGILPLFRTRHENFLFHFSDSTWAFPPIAHVLRPQSHGGGRALVGMSPRTLREARSSKARFSASPVRNIAHQPKSDRKNLGYLKL